MALQAPGHFFQFRHPLGKLVHDLADLEQRFLDDPSLRAFVHALAVTTQESHLLDEIGHLGPQLADGVGVLGAGQDHLGDQPVQVLDVLLLLSDVDDLELVQEAVGVAVEALSAASLAVDLDVLVAGSHGRATLRARMSDRHAHHHRSIIL